MKKEFVDLLDKLKNGQNFDSEIENLFEIFFHAFRNSKNIDVAKTIDVCDKLFDKLFQLSFEHDKNVLAIEIAIKNMYILYLGIS